jgi:hypothetical protein
MLFLMMAGANVYFLVTWMKISLGAGLLMAYSKLSVVQKLMYCLRLGSWIEARIYRQTAVGQDKNVPHLDFTDVDLSALGEVNDPHCSPVSVGEPIILISSAELTEECLMPPEGIDADDLYNLGNLSSEYGSDKLGGTVGPTTIADSIRPRSGDDFCDSPRLFERVGGAGKKVEEESDIEVYVIGSDRIYE